MNAACDMVCLLMCVRTSDAKLAIAVSEERACTSALRVRLEEAETAARTAAAAAKGARDREVRSTRAAAELMDLVRQQKVIDSSSPSLSNTATAIGMVMVKHVVFYSDRS